MFALGTHKTSHRSRLSSSVPPAVPHNEDGESLSSCLSSLASLVTFALLHNGEFFLSSLVKGKILKSCAHGWKYYLFFSTHREIVEEGDAFAQIRKVLLREGRNYGL